MKSTYLSEDEVIRFLKQDTDRYRILPLGSLANENRWSAFKIESIEGYHPAKIFRYNKVKDEVGWSSLGILQMLNVKYVITLDELPHPAFEIVFSGNIFHQGKYQKAKVYKFKYFIPRVYFADQLQNIAETNLQLQALMKPDFDPLKSNRCLNSFKVWSTAFFTSCMSTVETTSKEAVSAMVKNPPNLRFKEILI